MRIAYVADIRLPTERAHGLQIMEMCRAFARAGHEVRLFVPTRRSAITATPWEHYGMEPEFTVVRIPTLDLIPFDRLLGRLSSMLNALFLSRAARRAVREFAPDVVYMREPWFIGVDPRATYILEAHDFPSRITFLHRRAWAAVSRIVTVTDGLRRAFRTAGISEAKLVVAHDAVDLASFDVREGQGEARAALGLPPEGFIAVYAGHLYPYKGADDLLEACLRLRPSSRVIFVGGRPGDLARLKDRATGLDVRNAVLIGPVPHAQVPLWLRAADAAVLPTRADGRHAAEFLSPLKLFEYLAAGKAIVATATPSTLEVLDDATAVLVPPSDPAALADALNGLADAPARREALGRAARATAERHTWRRRAETVLASLPEPHPFRAWRRRHRDALQLAALAFAIRALYVLCFPQVPLSGGDAPHYLAAADALRGAIPDGQGPTFFQPLYPMFLAAIRALAGESLAWIRLAQAALSAGTVFLIATAARQLASPRAGRWAGLMAVLWAPSVVESGILYTETLYAFLLTASVVLLLQHLERPRAAVALLAGGALALAGLTREIAFYLAFLLAPLAAVLRRPRRLAALLLIPAVVAMALVASVSARTAQRTGDADAPLLSKGYERTLADPVSQAFLRRWEMYPEGAWRFFRSPHRLAEISDELSTRAVLRSGRAALIVPHLPILLAKLALTAVHLALLGLGAWGLLRGRMRRDAKLVIAFVIAFACGTIVVASVARLQGFAAFEPLARYRFPVDPLILILAAAGLDRLARKLP